MQRETSAKVARKAKKASAGGAGAPSAAKHAGTKPRPKANADATHDKAEGRLQGKLDDSSARSKLKQVFDELDKDGSDELDYADLKEALRTFGVQLSLSELKHVWTAADKDASSGLSFDEFVAAIDALPERLPQRRRSMVALVERVRGNTPDDDADPSADRRCAVM